VQRHAIQIEVNGSTHEVEIDPADRLVDVLRGPLGLTGTKEGCSVGVCGLCSVRVDGELVSACLLPAVLTDGSSIETVEGLAGEDGTLAPMQEAFIRHGGFQCGICTPGQLMAATSLLREHEDPSDEEVGAWMMGNLCRCTGYEGIRTAIRAAAAGGDA